MSDMWGPAHVEAIGKWKYYILFMDDAKHYVMILFLCTKSEVQSWIKEYVNMIKNKFGHAPKYLQFDNRKKLVNRELEKFASDKGMIIETTAPYSPSQNGVAERFNRILLELVLITGNPQVTQPLPAPIPA